MTTKEFDIVIFGATGYTGQYVIEELANYSKSTNIKWAVAGRSIEKVEFSLQSVQKYLQGVNILNIPIIKADVGDKASINEMCKRAKLILNCVGPYKLYGDVVVSACIENNTHHVDISGEFHFLEKTQTKYFQAAKEKKIYIVQACGFDSIPSDYGSSYLKKHFPGDLNAVEYYVEIGQGPEGRSTNTGTLMSAAGAITDMLKFKQFDRELKENLFKKPLKRGKYRLPFRLPLFYSEVVKGCCAWFLGPDERVLKRSQLFRNEFLNERPIQVKGFVKVSLLTALYAMFFLSFFAFFSLFSFGRYLIGKYPSFFTAGAFSKTGPTRKQVEEGSTKVTLIGHGWKDKLAEPSDDHVTKPDTKMKLTISGPEPAYPFTAKCMVHSGLVILQESDKMPLEGGVLTPGVAFENTTLSQRLQKHGISFVMEEMK